jgi:hypothetical protein
MHSFSFSAIKKKIKQFEENFEEEQGFKVFFCYIYRLFSLKEI